MPSTTRDPTVRRETTYARVLDRLREDILTGRVLPGERLTAAALAERYESSSMPVRVALQELQAEGFVTIEPRRGAWVRELDETFVENLYDLRIAVMRLLYPQVVRYLANVDLEEIEAIQSGLEKAVKRGDLAAICRESYRFHMRIFSVARNPEAFRVMERTWVLVNGLRAKYGFGRGRLDDANRNHRELIEALRRRKMAAALELAESSASRAKVDLVRLVKTGR